MLLFECGHPFKNPVIRVKKNKETYECRICHNDRNKIWARNNKPRKGKWQWKKLI